MYYANMTIRLAEIVVYGEHIRPLLCRISEETFKEVLVELR